MSAALALALGSGPSTAAGLDYHGSLQDAGAPANGRYDLRVALYGSQQALAPLAPAVTLYGVEVRDGRFSTDLDFGAAAQNGGWIGVAVRKAGAADFVDLAGRTAVQPDGTCPDAWLLTGNSGGGVLGTVDASPLVLQVNNAAAATFRPQSGGASFETGLGIADAPRAAATNFGSAHAWDSFAGGYSGRVSVGHDRSFVWGGTNRVPYVDSTGPDEFAVWADGGFFINSTAQWNGDDDLTLAPRAGGDSDSDLRFLTRDGIQSGLIYESNASGILVISATGGVDIISPVLIDGELKVAGTASKSTAGAWAANSDRRIKQEIEPVANALETLGKLHPVSFRYTDDYRAEHAEVADLRYYNVIAQEFAEVFPDAVTGSGEYLPNAGKTPQNEILQVDTYPAQIVTIAAVQELAQKNAALQATVDRLTARLEKLEATRER